VLFSSDLTLIRSAHTNNAGWLNPSTMPPTTALDQAAVVWAQTFLARGAADPGRVAMVTRFGPALAGVTALAIEELDTLPPVDKLAYYTNVHVATLATAPNLIRHGARRYADSTFPGAAFIEVSAEGCGGLSRIVWDIMRDQYYVGAHYHWVEGYNPFIHVTGLGATY
jgi:hypothetical protein